MANATTTLRSRRIRRHECDPLEDSVRGGRRRLALIAAGSFASAGPDTDPGRLLRQDDDARRRRRRSRSRPRWAGSPRTASRSTWCRSPGSGDCVKAVATRDVLFSLPSVEPLAVIRTQGVKAKMFYTAYQGNIYGFAVPDDSPIKSVADLRGKKIGLISMGSAGADRRPCAGAGRKAWIRTRTSRSSSPAKARRPRRCCATSRSTRCRSSTRSTR